MKTKQTLLPGFALFLSSLIGFSPALPAADQTTSVNAVVEAGTARLTEIFKDLHQNPVLGFMETRTAGIITNELKALGSAVKTGIGKTGVVGSKKNGDRPILIYRAGMDHNALHEASGRPWSRTKTGIRKGSSVRPFGGAMRKRSGQTRQNPARSNIESFP